MQPNVCKNQKIVEDMAEKDSNIGPKNSLFKLAQPSIEIGATFGMQYSQLYSSSTIESTDILYPGTTGGLYGVLKGIIKTGHPVSGGIAYGICGFLIGAPFWCTSFASSSNNLFDIYKDY